MIKRHGVGLNANIEHIVQNGQGFKPKAFFCSSRKHSIIYWEVRLYTFLFHFGGNCNAGQKLMQVQELKGIAVLMCSREWLLKFCFNMRKCRERVNSATVKTRKEPCERRHWQKIVVTLFHIVTPLSLRCLLTRSTMVRSILNFSGPVYHYNDCSFFQKLFCLVGGPSEKYGWLPTWNVNYPKPKPFKLTSKNQSVCC